MAFLVFAGWNPSNHRRTDRGNAPSPRCTTRCAISRKDRPIRLCHFLDTRVDPRARPNGRARSAAPPPLSPCHRLRLHRTLPGRTLPCHHPRQVRHPCNRRTLLYRCDRRRRSPETIRFLDAKRSRCRTPSPYHLRHPRRRRPALRRPSRFLLRRNDEARTRRRSQARLLLASSRHRGARALLRRP